MEKTEVVQLREPYCVQLTCLPVDSENMCSVGDILNLIATRGVPFVNGRICFVL